MKFSQRDKYLTLVLPGLLVLLGYGQFFLKGRLTEHGKTAAALAKAQSSLPSPTALEAAQANVLELAKDNDRAQTQIEQTKQVWQASIGAFAAPVRRNERIEKLTHLLIDNKLEILDDREADANKEGRLVPALEQLSGRISELSGGHKPQLRRIRVHGRYADVHRSLEVLSQGPLLAIPVGLSMKRTGETERREWTLFVWI